MTSVSPSAALAADRVVVRDGTVLNPHYRSMGNLYHAGRPPWAWPMLDRLVAD